MKDEGGAVTAQPPDWFTAALAAPPDDGSVGVAGARSSYRAWGPAGAPGVGPVDGPARHARWWDHIGPFLQGSTSGEGASPDGAYPNSGLRVAALSMSGHGDSDWRDRYGIGQWAAEVMAVAAAARIA